MAKKDAKKKVSKVRGSKPDTAIIDEASVTPEVKIAEISKEVAKVEKTASVMVVKTETDYKTANEFLVGLKGRLKRIEELRLFFVKPLKEQAKKIDAMFAEQSAPLEAIETTVKRAMSDFQLEKDRAARKEEERLAALRAKQDERREEKGLTPIATPLPTTARPETTVQSESGRSTAVKVWKFEVLDINKVPRHLLRCEVKHSAVQAQIDAGAREIDGLRIYEDVEIRASAK